MTAVYCFSGSGHSMSVSKALAEMLGCEIKPICFNGEKVAEETVVVVFPVYCQNIPKPVKQFLKRLEAKYIALIAVYGKISYGNVLYEAQKMTHGEIIAGAYIPMGHTFLDGDHAFDAKQLLPIAQRIKAPQKAAIPKTRKNPLANIFPGLRSRIGVKITKDGRCDNCGQCARSCPMGAIRNGRIYSQCIRCLRCVTSCPQMALQYKNRWVLDKYLKSYHKEEYVLYL